MESLVFETSSFSILEWQESKFHQATGCGVLWAETALKMKVRKITTHDFNKYIFFI